MGRQEVITIRPLLATELVQLKSVAVASFDQTFAPFNTPSNMEYYYKTFYSQEQLEYDLAEPGAVCLMAWIDAEPVGFVRMRTNNEVESTLGPSAIELQRLYIHPDHQGKKIGSKLMQRALDYAASIKCEWIWLGVWENNYKAQEFYDKWGFQKFSEHTFQMGDDPQIDWLLKRRVIGH